MPLLQFAAIAIMFRQTNVVWAIFVTCVGILEILKLAADSNIGVRKKELQHTTSGDGTISMDAEGLPSVRRRRAPDNAEVDYIRPDITVQEEDSYSSGGQGRISYCLCLNSNTPADFSVKRVLPRMQTSNPAELSNLSYIRHVVSSHAFVMRDQQVSFGKCALLQNWHGWKGCHCFEVLVHYWR